MSTLRRQGRVAGFLYLLLLFAPLRLMYIPAKLFVRGDAAATAANIAAHETLFRLGILADLFTGVAVLLLVLALYRLFHPVNRTLAVLLVIWGGLMVTPIYFLNTVNDLAALTLIRGADFLSPFDQAQRYSLAMLFLRLHDYGVVVNEVFWGLWLLPFGALIVRSRYLPPLLGYWLALNGVAYVVIAVTGVMWPAYHTRFFNYLFPVMVAELAVMLWLLIRGAREPAPAPAEAR